MHKVLLITVTKVEAQTVLSVAAELSGQAWKRHYIGDKTYYYLGMIGGVEVFMVRSEMGTSGPGSAQLTAYKAIEALSPIAVIMVGIAFGVSPTKQKIGDILVSRQLQAYEPQKVTGQRRRVILPRGDRVTASTRLLDRFRDGELDWTGAPVRFGLILSGEKLIANQALRNQLLSIEPEAIGGEMEGSGLYAAAQDAKVEWILVKAICDWADGNKNDSFQSQAALNAVQYTFYVISQGGLATFAGSRAPVAPIIVQPSPPESQAVSPEKEQSHRIQHKGSEYIYIPAGPFKMGTSLKRAQELNAAEHSQAYDPEVPQHEVDLPGFYIARFPVTNAEYFAFTQSVGYRLPYRDDSWSQRFNWDPQTQSFPPGRENYPVVLVSWYDAQAYCRWVGGRLPSEAEWEKAARGVDGLEWPWGSYWQDDRCNAIDTGIQDTTPVGYFSPRGDSPYGVSDMAGNVWEWCSSLRDPYPYRSNDGREVENSLGPRVIRGGAWGLSRWVTRCAYRGNTYPGEYGFSIGFRVVLSARPKD